MVMKKDFNIIISGIGGQGLITLLQIISEAALMENFEVKTSELHGLSQRAGSVEVHIRFGKKIYSPLVVLGRADLILALEISEALKVFPYSNNETVFLINENFISFYGSLNEKEIKEKIKSIKNPKYLVSASKICADKLGAEVVSGVYLLGYAVYKKLIPLKPNSILNAMVKVIPQKYLELNQKAFELTKK